MTSPPDPGLAPGASRTPSPAPPMGDDQRWTRTFVYEETKRVLDRQAAVLSELRNRANIVLAADAVVASLFGASALGKGHLLALKILALAAFAVGIAACVVVLWPVHDTETADGPRPWQVTFDLADVLSFMESRDDTSWQRGIEMFETARKANWATIDRRTFYLEAAGVFLAVQIGLWAAVVLG